MNRIYKMNFRKIFMMFFGSVVCTAGFASTYDCTANYEEDSENGTTVVQTATGIWSNDDKAYEFLRLKFNTAPCPRQVAIYATPEADSLELEIGDYCCIADQYSSVRLYGDPGPSFSGQLSFGREPENGGKWARMDVQCVRRAK